MTKFMTIEFITIDCAGYVIQGFKIPFPYAAFTVAMILSIIEQI
jgi:hypothetical protein